MGHRAKVWNKRSITRNTTSIKRSYGSNVDLSQWEEEAVSQRNLNKFYREQKMKSLRERIRKFVVRRFLNRKKKGGE